MSSIINNFEKIKALINNSKVNLIAVSKSFQHEHIRPPSFLQTPLSVAPALHLFPHPAHPPSTPLSLPQTFPPSPSLAPVPHPSLPAFLSPARPLACAEFLAESDSIEVMVSLR